jgi:tetratricopeptide (TPR) repeat protein
VALDRLDDARSCYDRALTISIMTGYRRGECLAREGIATVLLRTGQTREALDQCRRTLTLARTAGYLLLESRLMTLMGDIYQNCERPLEAVGHYRRAMALRHETDYRRHADKTDRTLKRLLRAKGDPALNAPSTTC